MNANKRILIIQLIAMYVCQLPFTAAFILSSIPAVDTSITSAFVSVGFIMLLLYIPLVLASLIIALRGFMKNREAPIETTIVVKSALIPWYIMNFIICFSIVAGALNPFLLIAIPFIIGLEILFTWNLMFSTSLHVLASVTRKLLNGEIKFSLKMLIGVVFLFMFCFDLFGVLLLKEDLNKVVEEC